MHLDFNPLRAWLFIHVIAAALWIGGTVVCNLMAAELRKLTDTGPRLALVHALGRVEVWCLLAGAMVALFSGFQLIFNRPAGMEPWLHPKLLLFLLAGITSTVAAGMSRGSLAGSLAADASPGEAGFARARGRYAVTVAVTGVLLAGAVFMVIFGR